jgi:hypothetical protein
MEYMLTRLSDELTLNSALLKFSKGIFVGDTNPNARRDKARHIIKEFARQRDQLLGHSLEWWFVKCYSESL